ncbi:MAG: TrkH family potassium uptake protein [Epsilonproteobacteria bacterium]|nr:potassium transporter [Campylobacterota bacterium]NPA56484.1 TrkH family potassium uptake protein [Campylobacterota bacterium]
MDLQSLKRVVKFLSIIGIVISLFLLLPTATGYIYNEEVLPFALFNLSLLAGNGLLLFLLRSTPLTMTIKEGILAVNLVWILLGLVGGIAFCLGSEITLAQGFFEAVSGFTTTGATIYTEIEALPHYLLLFRSLTHWLGGMGIVVLGVGLLNLINPTGSLTLFRSESTGITLEKLTPKIRDTALRLWGIYLLLTVADLLLLKVGGMDLFDGINHAFSTISTGGFSTKSSSLGYWEKNYYILWVTTLFMVVSAINFIAHLRALNGDFRGYRSEEVVWFLAIFSLLSLILTVVHIVEGRDTPFHSLTHSFFTIASIMTTTGFASTDYSQWSSLAIATIFIPMFIGGNAGSTAGGVKVIRYIVLFKTLSSQIKQLLHPKAVTGIYIDGSRIRGKIVASVTGLFFLFTMTLFLLTLYLFAEGYDFLTSFSASLAVVGNIGPGFGHVGPADNFSLFTDTQKVILAIAMIIGRLEFYTFILLFSREFWKRF